MIKNRYLKLVFSLAFISLIAFLFAKALADNWEKVGHIGLSINLNIISAIVLFAVAVMATGYLWGLILRKLEPNTKVSNKSVIIAQIESWLLKYIPGQVGSIGSKLIWGSKNGYSKKFILISFVYENLFLMIASLLPMSLILLIDLGPEFIGASSDNNVPLPVYLLTVIPFLILMSRPVMSRLFKLLTSRLKGQAIREEWFMHYKALITFQLAFLVPRLINSVAFVLIAVSLFPVSADAYVPLGAIYAIAGAVGILAVFVPSGLGVRESVIVLLASNYIGTEQAIVLSLIARLYSTIADGLLGIIYFVLKFRFSREDKHAS